MAKEGDVKEKRQIMGKVALEGTVYPPTMWKLKLGRGNEKDLDKRISKKSTFYFKHFQSVSNTKVFTRSHPLL